MYFTFFPKNKKKMAPTPNTRKEFLSLINTQVRSASKKNKKKNKKKKKQSGRGRNINKVKNSNFIKNIEFIKNLTNPKSTTMKRRKCLCEVLSSSQKGASKLRAVTELISNIHATQSNMNIPRGNKMWKKINKHQKDLSKFIKSRNKKEKIRILHKNCQKGGLIPILGSLIPIVLKGILGG